MYVDINKYAAVLRNETVIIKFDSNHPSLCDFYLVYNMHKRSLWSKTKRTGRFTEDRTVGCNSPTQHSFLWTLNTHFKKQVPFQNSYNSSAILCLQTS